MPSSSYNTISAIVSAIMQLNPTSVLDIGPGFGKYGVLAREYLELWDSRNEYDDWKRTIDCLEINKDYITDLHTYIYDDIIIGNALDVKIEKKYDLILMIDVIEHFTMEDGKKVLKKLLKKCKDILIVTPKKYRQNKDSNFGYEFEEHKSLWLMDDFGEFKINTSQQNENFSLVLLEGNKK